MDQNSLINNQSGSTTLFPPMDHQQESTSTELPSTTASEGTCEIGSLEMPPAEWLFSAAAAFQQSYGQIHPYLAAGLCIAGTIMNLVTVLVLTRPSMRSPVNVLLCAVACCDILVESSYLVFVLHFLIASAQRCEPSDFSWAWAIFMIIHAHASVIFHAASIWMTVSLAQIRVLTIRRATTGPTTPLITERFTAILALLTTLAMVLVNLPNFLTFEIMEVPASAMLPCWQPPELGDLIPSIPVSQIQATTQIPENIFNRQNLTENMENVFGRDRPPNQMELEKEIEQLIANLTGPIWSTIAPMLANAAAGGGAMINNSRMRRQHRIKRFRRDISMPSQSSLPVPFDEPFVYTVRAHESDCMKLKLAFWSNGMIFKVIPCLLLTLSIVALLRIIADVGHKRKKLAQVMRKKVPKDHTTPMLAAILLIFLLAELPQGVFLVLNGIFSSESFHKRVYLPLGDLMDLLSLLNSAVGFLIYVGMSRKFRTVFLQLLFSAISCIFRALLCVASTMFSLVHPTKRTTANQQQNQCQKALANENGTNQSNLPQNTSMAPSHAAPFQQSLRRFQQKLLLENEFSDTLKLLDAQQRMGPVIRKQSSPHQFGSEKEANGRKNSFGGNLARKAMKLRSMSTDTQYGTMGQRRRGQRASANRSKKLTLVWVKNGGGSKEGGTVAVNTVGLEYKTPCAPWGIPATESTDGAAGGGSKSWRRTSASQQLFHSGFHHHTEQQQPNGGQHHPNLANGGKAKVGGKRGGGRGKGWKKCRKGRTGKGRNGGDGDFGDGWMRWRKLSRNTRSTELTGTTYSRTEQLSLCPSSLLGLPPITLAFSCSAGITAAAASVGVHLLQLDPPTSSSASGQPGQNSPDRLSTSISSPILLLAPPKLPSTINGINRKQSNGSDFSNASLNGGSQHFLNVPGQQPLHSPSSIFFTMAAGETCPPAKRASFLSLRGEDNLRLGQQQEKPAKRISFNLPPMESQKEEKEENGKKNGNYNLNMRKGSRNGLGQKLRRSFLLSLAANTRKLDSMVDEEGESRLAMENREEEEGNNDENYATNATSTDDAECPGKALLKLQRQGGNIVVGGNRSSKKGRKLTTALARALLGRLAATTTTKGNDEDPDRIDSTGSGSPQHKFGALRAETNYNGWMAYC